MQAEWQVRGFTCWGQLGAMLFCQLGRAHSLRELCGGLASCEGKLSHLGMQAPRRSRKPFGSRQWAGTLIADRFASWCADRGVALRYIQPCKPDQNSFIERFNRTYLTEVLNVYVLEFLEQVREISAEWLQSYNEERPHDALADLPPATYRAQLEAGNSPLPLSP
jgi:hypothetical protein